jgi:aryl-alcohol dehydrogenase-like predicted oxidoreductase
MPHDFHTHRGFATPEGTARFAARADGAVPEFFGDAGGLAISSVGIGTYLGPPDEATDQSYVASIRRALALGVNHIDTAVNYRFQRSERAIGLALEHALHAKECKRDEVLVATKAGYVPFDGGPPSDGKGWIEAEILGKGLARPDELVAGCHCIAPAYLDGMLSRSLHNLRLDTVDVLYLHNPEQQLEGVARDVFLSRVRAAFGFLEGAVAAGRVRAYGTATWNGYRVPPGSRGHLSLAELEAAARDVAGADHHFRFVQLPYNLEMTEAARTPTQDVGGRRTSLVAAARDLGIHVSCSASMLQGRLGRSVPAAASRALSGLASDGQRALQFVRSTPGVLSALVGMASVHHVEDNLGLRGSPRASAGDLAAI